MHTRSFRRLIALGVSLAACPLLACDRSSDGNEDDGSGSSLDVDEVGQAWCQHQWDCYNATYEPEYTVQMCVAEWETTFADYAASEDEACVQGQLDYYACLGSLECGAIADYYEGEEQPGTEPPCNVEANALEGLCSSESTESDPGGP